jgi:signal transduction histidine kinase
LLASADILERDGHSHVFAQGVDITERKRANDTLDRYRLLLEERVEERSEQLRDSRLQLRDQQQLAAVGTLAAGLAHQINNPIGSMLAAAELALLNDEEPDREELRTRALVTTVDEARRCGRIVSNMLKFSRHEPTAKWVEDLNDIVRRAAELTRQYVTKTGGTLEVKLNPGALPARVSPIDIEQVLVNLIRNAAESSERGANVIVSTQEHGGGMSIEVADDGDGVAPEDRDHVFAPFFTTRLESGGSGLGLSVAQGIVVDHGGTIEFNCEPEKGTRVVVRIPLHVGEP